MTHWTDRLIAVENGEFVAYDEAGLEHGRFKTHDEARDSLVVHAASLNTALATDTELLDWLERKAGNSRTGITLNKVHYVEEGRVIEKGFQVMWHRLQMPLWPTLRAALTKAMRNYP